MRRYIPELPDPGARITLRHLLHHTSGLRDYLDLLEAAGGPRDGVLTEEDVLDLMKRQKTLHFKPGDQFVYSNTNYALLGIIVRRVSGQSLPEFARGAVFEPLGFRSIAFREDHHQMFKSQALAYVPRATGDGYGVWAMNFDVVGAAGVFATATDLARWDPAAMEQQLGIPGFAATVTAPGRLNDGSSTGYAMGFAVATFLGLRGWAGSGGYDGVRTFWTRLPDEQFGLATLCNADHANAQALSRRVIGIYLSNRLAPPQPPPSVPDLPKPADMAASALSSYAGVYWNEETEEFRRVTLRDNVLVVGAGTGLTPLGEGRFRAGTSPRTLAFSRSGKGDELTLEDTAPGPQFGDTPAPSVTRHFLRRAADARPLRDYEGRYYGKEVDGLWTIRATSDGLSLRRRHVPAGRLQHLFSDTFSYDPRVIRFTRDANGVVTGLTVKSANMRGIRFERQSS